MNKKNLKIYFDHLQKNLRKPIILKVLEETPWDILHFIGHALHSSEVLKSKIPLIKDKFEFIELVNDFDEQYGLYAMVERLNDRKHFKLVLFELMCVEKNSKNYELINDYSDWFLTNYYNQ